jgi:methyl-accepting chemotaxis protein
MSAGKRPYKRRQFYVKKGFQFRFIVKFCILVFLGTLFSTGLLFFFSQGTLTSSFHDSRLVIETTALAVLPAVLYTNLITLILITVGTVVVTLFISHKIAGPLFRFEQELKEIAEGDLTTSIRLREKDQISDVAEGLNRTVAALRAKVLSIQSDVKHLLELTPEQNKPETMGEGLKKLHDKIGCLFKT